MNGIMIYPAGNTAALRFACRNLEERGFALVSKPAPDVTHLLLPVPSFEPDGRIKGGGILERILADLPESVTVIGGNLKHPALQSYQTMDLLQDPAYIAENAAITADCAIRVAGSNLEIVFQNCPVLVIGWGRIGKCLAAQLKAMGANVTVAARKEADRAMLQALGYRVASPDELSVRLCKFRVIFNTVPALILSQEQTWHCQPECVLIDLASKQGIESANAIWARGLPNEDAPESSGLLIAKSIIHLLQRKEAGK